MPSTAATQAADALVAAADALRALADAPTQSTVVRTARVGQAIGRYASRAEIRAFLDSLPTGTAFEDRDGDTYTQGEGGYAHWEREGGVNPADYAPLTVVEVPASPAVFASVKLPEPGSQFEVYDGDSLIFTYEGNDSPNAVTVRVNSGVEVYVSPDEARSLITYLQQCLAAQGENNTPF